MRNLTYAILGAIGSLTMAAVYLITKLTPAPRKIKYFKKMFPGVANIGNTCFISSTLQALSACRGVDGWLESILDPSLSIKHLLAYELSHALNVLNNKSVESQHTYHPRTLLHTLMNRGWVIPTGEQDAFEFFHVLVETLNEENLNKSSAVNLSLFDAAVFNDLPHSITGSYGKACGILPRAPYHTTTHPHHTPSHSHPFRGRLNNQLTCKRCLRKTPARYDSFESISLHLPNKHGLVTLREMLARFVGVEVVGEMECVACKSKGDFYKRTSFAKLPPILCLQMQRTVWTLHGPTKRGDHVLFPDLLDMSACLSPSNRGGRGRVGYGGGNVNCGGNGESNGSGKSGGFGDGGIKSVVINGLSMVEQFKIGLVKEKNKKTNVMNGENDIGVGERDGGLECGDDCSEVSNSNNENVVSGNNINKENNNVISSNHCINEDIYKENNVLNNNIKEDDGKHLLINEAKSNNTNCNSTNNNKHIIISSNNSNTNDTNNNTNNNSIIDKVNLKSPKFSHRLYGGNVGGVSMWKALNFYSHVTHLSLQNVGGGMCDVGEIGDEYGGVIEKRLNGEVKNSKESKKNVDGDHDNSSFKFKNSSTFDLSNKEMSKSLEISVNQKFYPEKQFLSPSKNITTSTDDLKSLVKAYKQDFSQADTNGHSYRLMSVIVHLGTVASGHFIAYKRATSRLGVRFPNKWYLTSDELVRPVSSEEVFSSSAYMLIYEKI